MICPPRLFPAGAEIVVMLNCHHTSGSVGATMELRPSRIQPALELNHDHLIAAGQNPEDGCSWRSQFCSRQEAAQ